MLKIFFSCIINFLFIIQFSFLQNMINSYLKELIYEEDQKFFGYLLLDFDNHKNIIFHIDHLQVFQ